MKIKGCLLIVFLIIFLVGCGNEIIENKEENKEEKDAEIKIGFVFDTFVMERWQRDRDVFVSKAKELGASVIVQNANGSIQKQREQIEYFIEKEVDAIVVVPIETSAIEDVLRKAKKQNIKVIAYDRILTNIEADLYISFDNEKVGMLMAESVLNKIGDKAKVIILSGPTTDNNVFFVEQGIKKVFKKTNIEIIDTVNIPEWKKELAGEYVNDNLEKIKKSDAIICGNDSLAGAVIEELTIKKLIDDRIVIGQDGDLAACQRLVRGTQYMTVFKEIDKLASFAASYTVNLINGKEIRVSDSMYDGAYYIKYIGLEPVAVTKSNIFNKIIDTGYYLEEEIFLNDK